MTISRFTTDLYIGRLERALLEFCKGDAQPEEVILENGLSLNV